MCSLAPLENFSKLFEATVVILLVIFYSLRSTLVLLCVCMGTYRLLYEYVLVHKLRVCTSIKMTIAITCTANCIIDLP